MILVPVFEILSTIKWKKFSWFNFNFCINSQNFSEFIGLNDQVYRLDASSAPGQVRGNQSSSSALQPCVSLSLLHIFFYISNQKQGMLG